MDKILELYKNESPEKMEKLKQYISEMDTLEKKACEIARDHLGTSFNIFKSNGYIEWCKKGGDKK